MYCRQDSNLRRNYVPYNIESVATSSTSLRQHMWAIWYSVYCSLNYVVTATIILFIFVGHGGNAPPPSEPKSDVRLSHRWPKLSSYIQFNLWSITELPVVHIFSNSSFYMFVSFVNFSNNQPNEQNRHFTYLITWIDSTVYLGVLPRPVICNNALYILKPSDQIFEPASSSQA